MRSSPPVSRPLALVAAWLCAALLAAPAGAQDRSIHDRLTDLLRPVEPFAATGVLYDRVLPLAGLDRLDGGEGAPVLDAAAWRQAYHELRRATLGAPAGPDLAALDAGARAARRAGVIPLALLDRAFERLRPGALEDGSLRLVDGRLAPTGGTAPLVRARALAAAALAPRTHHGAGVTFALDPERCFTDGPAPRLALDLADGRGFRPYRLGERVRASYAATGPRTLAVRVTRADGSQGVARFTLEVAALDAPAPNDTLPVTATVPYQGQYGTGQAYLYLAPGHTTIVNPAIVVEGFDIQNDMDWDELYTLLYQQGMIEALRSEGFDAVVLDFTDSGSPIEENAFVVAELIQQVQAQVAPTTTLALVGASMGALCTRYALAWMETHAVPHRVRTWLSFDGPHTGADIPLGLQYWVNFFAGQSAEAADMLAALQSPAARQLLHYHFTTPAGTTGQADPLRDSLLAHLAAVGDWPAQPRRVALANGSAYMLDQGFAPGAQLIQYEFSNLLTTVKGNVWAVPDQVSGTIFDGSLRILFSTTSQKVTVSGTLPWDGAPGGSRPSMFQMDTTAAPYGDIVALHPSHCFIPTISALALPTSDPFFDVAGTPNLLALTPWDAIHYAAVNEEHVTLSADEAAWVRAELEWGVLAVPGGGRAAEAALRLAAAPNPFAGGTRLAFTLPREGPASLRVYDVGGREVRTLASGARAAGPQAVEWDGRDTGGRRVADGVYFLRLEAAGQTLTKRVVKLD